MTNRFSHSFVFAFFCIAIIGVAHAADSTAFRGSDGSGVSTAKDVPVALDDETKTEIAWSAPLPGRGPASPIVVGNRVFVAASSGARGDRIHLVCIDLESGKKLWERRMRGTGSPTVHPFGANAAPTSGPSRSPEAE